MARDRRPEPRPTALVASGERMEAGNRDFMRHTRAARDWQAEAWRFYDIIGEFRYACDWIGSMLAKATLHVVRETSEGPIRVTEGPAVDALTQLFNGPEGQAEMLRQVGIHFTVAGECWLFGWEDGPLTRWMVAATSAVTSRVIGPKDAQTTAWYVNSVPVGGGQKVLAIRLWKPHPLRPFEANAPARAVLPILAEIESLTLHVQAQVTSRLAGAGIMWAPSEITLPAAPPDGNQTENAPVARNTASEFMHMLQAAMRAAIQDRGSPSAVVPIVVTAPGDQIDNVRHTTFWSELDQHAIELRNEAIRRLSLGLDMPPEMLTGVGENNHWSAWLADESGIKAHTEPLLKVVTASLSEAYLRPALTPREGEEPVEDLTEYAVRADTSGLRLRPNRSREAIELYDRGELSGVALRRETGFGPEDALVGAEVAQYYLRHVAKGQTTPEIVEAALRAIGLDIMSQTLPQVQHEARPDPSLLQHPMRNPPQMDAALLEAGNQIVVRALERAGNRIRNRMQMKVTQATAMNVYRFVKVHPDDIDFYLDDAWTHVPDVAARHGVDPQWLTSALDTYCRLRLVDKERHTIESLQAHLQTCREMVP